MPAAFAVVPDAQALPQVLQCLQALRAAGVSVQMHAPTGGSEGMGSMKSQFKRADASGARYALIFGQAELAQGCVALKPLRGDPQEQVLESLSQVQQWAPRLR